MGRLIRGCQRPGLPGSAEIVAQELSKIAGVGCLDLPLLLMRGLDQVFQQGSAAMDADRDVILMIQSGGEATATRWSIDSQPSEWVVVERLGGTALIAGSPACCPVPRKPVVF